MPGPFGIRLTSQPLHINILLSVNIISQKMLAHLKCSQSRPIKAATQRQSNADVVCCSHETGMKSFILFIFFRGGVDSVDSEVQRSEIRSHIDVLSALAKVESEIAAVAR